MLKGLHRLAPGCSPGSPGPESAPVYSTPDVSYVGLLVNILLRHVGVICTMMLTYSRVILMGTMLRAGNQETGVSV